MGPGRRIVLDANILVRAVLGRRVKAIIEDHVEKAEFFAPEVAYGEAERHRVELYLSADKHDDGPS